jgi:hypothetical protein
MEVIGIFFNAGRVLNPASVFNNQIMLRNILYLILSVIISFNLTAQNPKIEYPKVTGYISVVHPIITAYENETTYNFKNDYTIGFPIGVNILKSDKLGFSFEITPFIKSVNGNASMSNLLFHPGVILRFPKGFSINNRMAFETSGRFGYTAVFSKVIARTPMHNFFVAMPVPFRFGGNKSFSVGAGLQVGITF